MVVIKLPFLGRGGSKEALREVEPVPKVAEDPFASLVSFYADGRTPMDGKNGVINQLMEQFHDRLTVDILADRIKTAREAKQAKKSRG
ncbi:hypothetical protein A2W70_05720 [Candidatus Curtissbacteria bacterium RIFCSPLOWO2_02_41_11]|uniref:Uncharacterized protein n=2 Tax=Candidatus Curtissiibacteriota TaxID=1752717 RepID=A0A1F5HPA5_9BACT|nr:MAG: hypothetical protein UU56_C0002G0093 [Candidatus Curtissbacteria bacterium GW2011_GWA2_41_24]OGE05971.1 MAG: hypothetical protein A2W70_05720 [Candidatus Curtissbacteria bacterium RIFCSPLOWO2_02_41_11]